MVDGQEARTDLHGLPIAPAPGQATAPLTTFELSPAPATLAKPTRRWIVPTGVTAVVVALVVALVVVVRQGDDRAAKDEAERSALSDQLESLGNDVSDLSSNVDDLSSRSGFDLSDFSDFSSDFSSSFSDLGSAIDPCKVLLPEDVEATLGIAVHVDRDYGSGFICLLTTDDRASGTAIIVRAEHLYGDLRDEFGNIPGDVAPRPVAAGDEAYVATAYGLVMGVVAKGTAFAQIQVETAGTAPSDEQVTALLVAAAGRL